VGGRRAKQQTRLRRLGDAGKGRRAAMSADLAAGLGAVALALVLGARLAAAVMAVSTAAALLHSYRCRRFADVVDNRSFLWLAGRVGFAAVGVVVLLGDREEARILAAALVAATVLGVVARWLIAQARRCGRLGLGRPESVLIVGNVESVGRTVAEWSDATCVHVAGACLTGTGLLPPRVADVPVVGRVRDIVTEAARLQVDVVALHDVENLGGYSLAALQWALEDNGVQMSLITPMTNTVVTRARTRRVGRRVTLDLAYCRPCGLAARAKGAVDRVVGAVALLFALPLIAVCAVIVRLTSRGPAFFTQTRVREHGREFPMYKLRTMTTDAEERLDDIMHLNMVGGDGMFKMVRDPRVTRAGAWMRRLSLDELPQLWNVVRGDMSLIGPRPGTPDEVATYDDLAFRRLAMKPGLTGLWQVSGRSNLTWEETVWIDQYYVDNWRPRGDVAIALRTVKALVTREGAY
jgi:exopolysaccharide biosynthesis polyprenyl glycosylphosphotransferase